MTDEKVIQLVEDEIIKKSLLVTEQYLEIHQPVYENNLLKILRIDLESEKNLTIVYLQVVNERFYFTVYIDHETETVIGFDTEPFIRIYFRATSEKMDLKELCSLTSLVPTESWNKGDSRWNGKTNHTFSSITFTPNPEPDTFESKLEKLLDFLEQDKKGIKNLVDNAFGYIQVAMTFHNGNGMIGGPSIEKESLHRMNELNLENKF